MIDVTSLLLDVVYLSASAAQNSIAHNAQSGAHDWNEFVMLQYFVWQSYIEFHLTMLFTNKQCLLEMPYNRSVK